MTSLQLAASSGKEEATISSSSPLNEIATSGLRRESGIFENSFQGLDLSEFMSGGSSSNITSSSSSMAVRSTISASAKLLKIKLKESKRANEEEEEEAMMEQQALRRAKEQTELLVRKREMNLNSGQTNSNGQMLSSLVVSMHQGDKANSIHNNHKMKQTSRRNGKQQRRNAVVRRNYSVSSKIAKLGGLAAKKTRKTKY